MTLTDSTSQTEPPATRGRTKRAKAEISSRDKKGLNRTERKEETKVMREKTNDT